MKSILVTGVGGFIGRALARHFTHIGFNVFGMDRINAENVPLADLAGYAQMELPSSRFSERLSNWRPDAILHCAGRASVPGAAEDPASDFHDGPELTFSLLSSLRTVKLDCAFVLFSSAAVYGNPQHLPASETAPVVPISAYGFHKWQSEIICQEHANLWGMRTASVRIFSAYGPGLRRQVMWDIVYKALTQSAIRLQGTGQESRDFIHIQDIARGVNAVLDHAPMKGEIYNLASGREMKIKDLADLIHKQLDCSSSIVFSGELPPGTPRNWRADMSLLKRFGFQTSIDLEKGIASFVDWAQRDILGV
jgi:UDP-glucose 4-epimerase